MTETGTPGREPGSGKRALGTLCGVTGLVMAFGAIVYFAVFPQSTPAVVIGPLVVAAVLLVIAAVTLFGALRDRLSQRSGVFLGVTILGGVAMLALLTGVNYLLVRAELSWDVTPAGVHSLSQQSQKVLAGLKDPVRITAFYERADPERGPLEDLVRNSQRYTEKLEYVRRSPTRDLQAVKRYDVTSSGPRIFVEAEWDDPRKKRMARFTIDMNALNHEEELTNAIIKVAQAQRPQLWWLKGHGEAQPSDSEPGGYRLSKDDLVAEGYEVVEANLVQQRFVAEGVSAVVVVGPRQPLLLPEVKALSAYLSRGGRVGVFLETGADHGLDALLGQYGVQANNDTIIDFSPYGQMFGSGPDTAIAVEYGEHAITEGFSGAATVFPGARSISINPVPGVELNELVKTSKSTWGETDVSSPEPKPDPGEVQGPVTLAVSASREVAGLANKKGVESRLLVVGDSSFGNNQFRGLSGNRNLFLNMVGWLSAQEERIAIRPPTRGTNQIVMSPAQREGITFVVIYLLPVVILALGLSVWLLRRMR
jgi:ABC-type uncharacterized transport system involved in gliding motility auxiliary subunit